MPPCSRSASSTFNPFTFAADVENDLANEADGSPIASFDLLRIDFSLRSISDAAVDVRGAAARRAANARAIDQRPTARSIWRSSFRPRRNRNRPSPAGVPALRIGTLAVHSGRVALDDESRGRPFNATLTPIEFTLTDFRTAPDFQNVYQFAASTLAGERLTWSGQFSVQPLGSTGKFAINALKAATITALSPGCAAVRRCRPARSISKASTSQRLRQISIS